MMPATDEQPTIHTGLPVLPPFQGIDATAAAPPMPSHFNEPSDESPIALATTAPRRAQPAPPPARGENETPSAPPGCALPGLPELPLFPTADAAAATAHTPTPSAAALDLFPPACYQSNPRCSGDAEAWAAAINEPGQGLAAALVASTPGDRPPSAPHSSEPADATLRSAAVVAPPSINHHPTPSEEPNPAHSEGPSSTPESTPDHLDRAARDWLGAYAAHPLQSPPASLNNLLPASMADDALAQPPLQTPPFADAASAVTPTRPPPAPDPARRLSSLPTIPGSPQVPLHHDPLGSPGSLSGYPTDDVAYVHYEPPPERHESEPVPVPLSQLASTDQPPTTAAPNRMWASRANSRNSSQNSLPHLPWADHANPAPLVSDPGAEPAGDNDSDEIDPSDMASVASVLPDTVRSDDGTPSASPLAPPPTDPAADGDATSTAAPPAPSAAPPLGLVGAVVSRPVTTGSSVLVTGGTYRGHTGVVTDTTAQQVNVRSPHHHRDIRISRRHVMPSPSGAVPQGIPLSPALTRLIPGRPLGQTGVSASRVANPVSGDHAAPGAPLTPPLTNPAVETAVACPEECDAVRAALAASQTDCARLRAALVVAQRAADTAAADGRAARTALREELSNYQDLTASLRTTASADAAAAVEQIVALQSDLDESEHLLADATEQLTTLRAELATSNHALQQALQRPDADRIASLEHELRRATERLTERDQIHTEDGRRAAYALAEARSALGNSKHHLTEVTADYEALLRAYSHEQAELVELRRDNADLRRDNATLQATADRAERRLQEATAAARLRTPIPAPGHAERLVATLTMERDDLLRRLDSTTAERDRMMSHRDSVSTAFTQLRSEAERQLEELRRALSTERQDATRLRAQLAEMPATASVSSPAAPSFTDALTAVAHAAFHPSTPIQPDARARLIESLMAASHAAGAAQADSPPLSAPAPAPPSAPPTSGPATAPATSITPTFAPLPTTAPAHAPAPAPASTKVSSSTTWKDVVTPRPTVTPSLTPPGSPAPTAEPLTSGHPLIGFTAAETALALRLGRDSAVFDQLQKVLVAPAETSGGKLPHHLSIMRANSADRPDHKMASNAAAALSEGRTIIFPRELANESKRTAVWRGGGPGSRITLMNVFTQFSLNGATSKNILLALGMNVRNHSDCGSLGTALTSTFDLMADCTFLLDPRLPTTLTLELFAYLFDDAIVGPAATASQGQATKLMFDQFNAPTGDVCQTARALEAIALKYYDPSGTKNVTAANLWHDIDRATEMHDKFTMLYKSKPALARKLHEWFHNRRRPDMLPADMSRPTALQQHYSLSVAARELAGYEHALNQYGEDDKRRVASLDRREADMDEREYDLDRRVAAATEPPPPSYHHAPPTTPPVWASIGGRGRGQTLPPFARGSTTPPGAPPPPSAPGSDADRPVCPQVGKVTIRYSDAIAHWNTAHPESPIPEANLAVLNIPSGVTIDQYLDCCEILGQAVQHIYHDDKTPEDVKRLLATLNPAERHGGEGEPKTPTVASNRVLCIKNPDGSQQWPQHACSTCWGLPPWMGNGPVPPLEVWAYRNPNGAGHNTKRCRARILLLLYIIPAEYIMRLLRVDTARLEEKRRAAAGSK